MGLKLSVAEIVAETGGILVVPAGVPAPREICAVATDSRTSSPGCLFVALRGPRTDGHAHVGDAEARGAALSLVSDPKAARGPAVVVRDTLRALGVVAGLHRRAMPATVVGVTGSVGKTTTVGLCAQVLSRRYSVHRSAESWNAELGVALSLLGLDRGHQVAVIEMAMRGLGQIRELVELALPRLGVVTNIGESHMELLGSREKIATAKAELLEGLPADGVAIVNADDPFCDRLVRGVRCAVLRFGFIGEADVRAGGLEQVGAGWTFMLHGGSDSCPVTLPLPGLHQVRNALAATSVGLAMGLPLGEAAAALAQARPGKMRQELLRTSNLLIIDDAYNASPQSMEAAFEVVSQVGGGRRRILALGEMLELGPDSPEFHHDVGRRAAALSPAYLLAVGPNAGWYLEGAAAAGMSAADMGAVSSSGEAVAVIRETVRPGDLVLIKGSRGVEMERVVEALRAGGPAI